MKTTNYNKKRAGFITAECADKVTRIGGVLMVLGTAVSFFANLYIDNIERDERKTRKNNFTNNKRQ